MFAPSIRRIFTAWSRSFVVAQRRAFSLSEGSDVRSKPLSLSNWCITLFGSCRDRTVFFGCNNIFGSVFCVGCFVVAF